jgi:TPR repeat protein
VEEAHLQEGHGVEQNAEGAYSMWMAAAKKGSREGMNNVGASLELGAGAKQDVKEAFKW